MKMEGDSLRLSATDLSGYLNCRHLANLEKAVATGAIERPQAWDPLLDVLWERGKRHEQNFVDHLVKAGFDSVQIEGFEVTDKAVADTVAAMQAGREVIIQGALRSGDWVGRPDLLRKVAMHSALGDWSYEPVDMKLARDTKGGSILQLCLYAELVADVQGTAPEFVYVVPPWTEFDQPQRYRLTDFAAYYRRVKASFAASVLTDEDTYPEPVEHCDVCRWRNACEKRRRDDDHLSLVAGISKVQIAELGTQGIMTMAGLAAMPLPLAWKPERGSRVSYERIREQARVQVDAQATGDPKVELLPFQPGLGFARLPEPDVGDVFLDLEGDPFVGEQGLEYLVGYHFRGEDGQAEYVGHWALDRAHEKTAFESFIDFVVERRKSYPDLHIYHFGGYEPGAMKRLMGRYGTREDELDNLLRGEIFVDLLSVVRQGIRAGVESYSIKKLEPFYGFERNTALPDANLALRRLQIALELDDTDGIEEDDRQTVRSYNRDDCVSTRHLRDWLEVLRAELIAGGVEIPRPQPGEEQASDNIAAWLARIQPLIDALTDGVPVDVAERAVEQQARWLLAHLLDWNRREEKSIWWEFFRLRDLADAELMDDKSGLSGLELIGAVGGTEKCPIHRYRFPMQDADLRIGYDLHIPGSGQKLGSIETVSNDALTIDIKKTGNSADLHPESAFRHRFIPGDAMAEARVRIAEYVVAHNMTGDGPYRAARDLLLREAPRLVEGSQIQIEGETTLDAGIRVIGLMPSGILPIQGPPGTGKTFTAAHMICSLVQGGKRVGIVANGHEVIRNLLNKVVEVAKESGANIMCVQKPKAKEPDTDCIRMVYKNGDALAALGAGVLVAGGTAWLWSCPEAFESLDVLFVDEAAQMSLGNVLAVSQAAQTVVLVGDPQQLDQPMQGTHPDGTDCSALDHILEGKQTIGAAEGLFIAVTWRLHPDICNFTSELFYEGKLKPKDGLELQAIEFVPPAGGAGLRFIAVPHSGNQSCSPEEAAAIEALVNSIIAGGAAWTDRHGVSRPIELRDILIIAPYNAQVFEIQKRLPNARVGTVDKFQGQEAPIAIYSLTTSSRADAPRGMEFLYSLNRLNVATSRARCVSIVVASPTIFEADCRTPRQMQLANAFSRYLEMVEPEVTASS
jgi:predicted RecB family nuclease